VRQVYKGRMKYRFVVIVALVLSACGDASDPRAADRVAPTSARAPFAAHRAHAIEDCSSASEADFPGAYAARSNLVVGPLAMVGAAFTDARTVREVGGNKFPLLVEAGHTATMRLAPEARPLAGLAYGPLPQGEVKLRDTYRSVRFVACGHGMSGSHADGAEVTFWSGFVLTRKPACIPLRISIDGGPSQAVDLPLGARC
jgi:hypothetical protein